MSVAAQRRRPQVTAPRKYRARKRRAPQGQLRNLTHDAREQLHAWFRENDGTIPLHEVQRRLNETFDVHTSVGSLSEYYNKKYSEIVNPPSAGIAEAKTIMIRVTVPAGCQIDVATEVGASAEGAVS